MKVAELNNKIAISEIDLNTDYIMLVNPNLVCANSLSEIRIDNGVRITYVPVRDVEKAVRFIKVPRKKGCK